MIRLRKLRATLRRAWSWYRWCIRTPLTEEERIDGQTW